MAQRLTDPDITVCGIGRTNLPSRFVDSRIGKIARAGFKSSGLTALTLDINNAMDGIRGWSHAFL
jgi:hypothetical protein